MADDVVVMLRGKKVEQGTVEEILRAKHPYTRALLVAVPAAWAARTATARARRRPCWRTASCAKRQTDQDTARYDEPVLRVELTTRFDVGQQPVRRVTHRAHAVEEVSRRLSGRRWRWWANRAAASPPSASAADRPPAARCATTARTSSRWTAPAASGCARRSSTSSRIPTPAGPRKTVAFSIAEPIRTHGLLSTRPPSRRVGELLEQVGLKPEHAARYPHEFRAASASACIARARWPATPSSSSPTNRCRAGRIDPGADPEPADGPAEGSWPVLPVHHPRHGGGEGQPPRGGAVPGPDRGTGHAPPDLESPQHALHPQVPLAAVPVAEPGRHIDTSLIEGEIPSPCARRRRGPSFPAEFAPGHLVARAA